MNKLESSSVKIGAYIIIIMFLIMLVLVLFNVNNACTIITTENGFDMITHKDTLICNLLNINF